MLKKVLLMCASLGLLAGCGHISGGVAPSTMPLAPGSYTELKEVDGRDCVYHLLGILPLSDGNETKDAVKDALQQAPGAKALVNVTADTFSQNFILISRVCTQVQGTAVSLK